jgi:hypothetical protein
MKEELLVYVWRYKLFSNFDFKTVNNDVVEISSFGSRNYDSGPDFFNAKIRIGDQLWAGNVEIHVNSSDWIKHKHQNDKAYNNVILHVVFNHDKDIEVQGRILPVLELRNYISESVISSYNYLTQPSKSFLHCANTNCLNHDFEYDNWIESIFIKRVEQKLENINNQLSISATHWEQVLFRTIARSFGLKLNGDAFANFSSSFNYKILQNVASEMSSVEALFFGQSGFLYEDYDNEYYLKLKSEYAFLRNKYSLIPINNSQFKFFRTRPANFPTIRLAQLASVYSLHPDFFSKIINSKNVEDIKSFFEIDVNPFWKTHYNFKSVSKESNRFLTDNFIELIILNSIIPIRFAYFKSISDFDKVEESIVLAEQLKKESNSIISEFEKQGWKLNNAKESQALLFLKKEYCDKNLCLDCLIGKRVLSRN